MLKLAQKSSELKHNKLKGNVYIERLSSSRLTMFQLLSGDFRTENRAGHGDVQRFRTAEARDCHRVIHLFDDGRADTVSFIAHNNQSGIAEVSLVDRGAFKQRAEGGQLSLPYKFPQLGIVHLHACQRTHRGLYHLRVKCVYRADRTNDMLYTKPLRRADNGAEIARVLYIIQQKVMLFPQLRPVKFFQCG